MEYRVYNNNIYLRLDKGDEVLSSVKEVCQKEGVHSCIFSGIGGCDRAEIGTFLIEQGTYDVKVFEGMLEVASLNGNIKCGEDGPIIHAHACLGYDEDGQNKVVGGHLLSLRVSITAEIEIRPVIGGVIKAKPGQIKGTKVWDFD